MIGGCDKIFNSRGPSTETAPLIASIVRRLWSGAVFEPDADDHRDFFVYQSDVVRAHIEEHGVTKDTDDWMFHFMIRETHFTVVIATPIEKANSKKLLTLLAAAGFEEAAWRDEWRKE